MYCMNCGNEIDGRNNICYGCGVRIDGQKDSVIDNTQEMKIEDNDRITDTIKKKYCQNCGHPIIDTKGSIAPININTIPNIPHTGMDIRNIGKTKKSGIAAVLSFIVPGLGQIYRGRIAIGSIFLIIGLALIEINRLLFEDPTFRKIIPDYRDAMIPGIRESVPDIRMIIFIGIYIIFWIYNTHHAYINNHEDAEKQVKRQIERQIEKI